ncbi:MAG: transporter [Flammeovirgaceae bacterium]
MNRFLLILFFLAAQLAHSQTLNDALMMPKKDFCTGVLYTHDQWKDYWEGLTKRDNQNIGTITTTRITWVGNYGITDKLNIIAMVPYVKTSASSGTLTGLEGVQDLTFGVKYNLVKKAVGTGNFTAFGVGTVTTPLTNYVIDFQPLSLGLGSTTIAGRLIANYRLASGWYATATAGYTWRSNVSIDRPHYYTDGNIYFTNQVWMPNQMTAVYSLGYYKNGLQTEINFTQLNTLGGGDIRKQDMPFVSNRMNAYRIGGLIMYYFPKPKNLAARVEVGYTIDGRNVGQAIALTGGLLYTFHFAKKDNQ